MKTLRKILILLLCLLVLPALADETARFGDLAAMDGQLLALDRRGVLAQREGAWAVVCPVEGGQLMAVSGETVYVLCREGVVRYGWQEDELVRQDLLIARDALPDSMFYDMAAEGDEVFLLGLPNAEGSYTRRSIYKFEDGAVRQLCEGDYTNLAIADGWLLSLARHEMDTILAAINRDTGRENNFAVLDEATDQGMLTGLAAADGYAYALGQTRLYRMNLDSGKVEIAAYALRDEQRFSQSVAAAVEGGAYRYLHSEQGLMAAGTDPAALAGRPLRVAEFNFGWTDRVMRAFEEKHPETAVEQKSALYGGDISAIVQTLINQDGGLDILSLPMQTAGAVAVLDKGYCLPLNCSEILMDYVDGIYPAIGDLLWRDGTLCAVPVTIRTTSVLYHEAFLADAGLTVDDLPTTLMELMDFIADWDEDQPVKLLEAEPIILRRQLFYLIRDTQEAWCAAHGVPMTWDAPEVLALLQKLDEITPTLKRFPPNPLTRGQSETLLNLLGDLTPSYFSQYDNYSPLPLSRAAGEDYYIKAYLEALAVNPYSASPEEAVELLECAVQYGENSGMIAMTLHPDRNDPVVDPRYVMEMDLIAEERVRYQAMLEDESLSDIERDNARHVLELYDIREVQAEEYHWALSEKQIVQWREIAPHVYVMPAPSSDVLLNVRDRYIDGQLSAEQYVREAENIMRMIELEQQ